AEDENGVPEPIRQGVLRLTAHLFSARDGAGGEPPAAVTALWRPYRRLRLS
ncbi:MAG: head-tail connector protein, partial [Sphingomicrobium sp.]